MPGNQYVSRKLDLMRLLFCARRELGYHDNWWARYFLNKWREAYAATPASTRRRWKCGR